ncbi:MAG: alanine racemase, partial [Comamonas sp.]|nr:alanine racemase [Candidatus Comamonas equi]
MPRPILATIHPQAIHHNLEQVRQATPDAKLMSMVTANAYGQGLENAFAGLRATDGLAVLEISEAQRLRALDWRGPILLIEGVFDARDLEMCSRLGLWHTV